jgi:hypothetical protein
MLLLVFAAAIAGCASTPGGASPPGVSAQQVVFDAKLAYGVALKVAETYESMPRCSVTVKQPCSDPAIVDQIRKAQPVARGALDAAESAARSNLGGDVTSKAITAANTALAAFQAITALIGGKS